MLCFTSRTYKVVSPLLNDGRGKRTPSGYSFRFVKVLTSFLIDCLKPRRTCSLSLPRPMQPNINRPHYQLQPETSQLYRGGVQHDTNRSTERLSGKGGGKSCADDSRVAVWPGDLAPDDADLRSTDLLLSAVDVGNLLAQVEVGSRSVVDALNLDQTGAGASDVTGSLVAQVTSLDV